MVPNDMTTGDKLALEKPEERIQNVYLRSGKSKTSCYTIEKGREYDDICNARLHVTLMDFSVDPVRQQSKDKRSQNMRIGAD